MRSVFLRAVLIGLSLMAVSRPAFAADDFYKGKTVTLIVGHEAGPGYDTYARLLARHMTKYIPGNPNVIVQNMPGASGLAAANHLYNLAVRDGTVIGMIDRNLPLVSLVETEDSKLKADITKYTWLGTMSSGAGDDFIMIVRSDSPVKSIDDLRKPGGPQLIMGSTPPGGSTYDLAAMLRGVLGLNIKIISGYSSSDAVYLAMDRKEVDGRMAGYSILKVTKPDWIPSGFVHVLAQMGRADRHPDFPNVPLSRELAGNDDDRALIELEDLSQLLSWPVVAPPEVPADRVAILRKAFLDTQSDPQYRAEAEKANMELSPLGGAQIETMLADFKSKLTPKLLGRYNDIVTKAKAEGK